MTAPAPIPFGGAPVEAWQLDSGDYIRATAENGSRVIATVTTIDRGPGHKPGGEGLDWECAWPQGCPPEMYRGHEEYGPHDLVTRVWAGGIAS